MVLVIIGVLAAIAAPQFVTTRGFASRGFYDEALGVVRFAQKTAIAWRRAVTVCVSATEIEEAGWRKVLPPSLIFVASFSVIFVLLGLTATGLGSALARRPYHAGASEDVRAVVAEVAVTVAAP